MLLDLAYLLVPFLVDFYGLCHYVCCLPGKVIFVQPYKGVGKPSRRDWGCVLVANLQNEDYFYLFLFLDTFFFLLKFNKSSRHLLSLMLLSTDAVFL